MQYSHEFIGQHEIPSAERPILQHLLDTYVSETNKVGAVWSELQDEQLDFRLHSRSSSVRQILGTRYSPRPGSSPSSSGCRNRRPSRCCRRETPPRFRRILTG